nr:MAG TPA: hypothetical protein [Caudoviricetes sp.]
MIFCFFVRHAVLHILLIFSYFYIILRIGGMVYGNF